MKSLIIFLILSLTLAVCPNGCSGNGVCNVEGNCDCFRQTGVALNGAYFEDYTYTGPDCSMRTCPKNFAFSGSANTKSWSNHDGPELILSNDVEIDATVFGVPKESYVRKLTVNILDEALEQYGLGGSMSCYENTHYRKFSRSYTILTYEKNDDGTYSYYGINDINKSDVQTIDDKLYCYIDYVRKDLSLFVNFQFAAGSAKASSKITLRRDLSTILMGYFREKGIAVKQEDSKDYKIACISSGNSKIIQSTVKMYETDCKEDNSRKCISVEMTYDANYRSGDRCFLMESGYNKKGGVYRELTLESSELYHYIGKHDGDFIFGRYLDNSALGYYVPNLLKYEDDLGTVFTQPTVVVPTEDTYGKDNDTVFIDFTKYCAGLKCDKLTPDKTLKSLGEFYQFLSLGQTVNVIRLITTREVEDQSGIGKPTTLAAGKDTAIIEDHSCYAHFIQLTIMNYEIIKDKGVLIRFNRPYHFVSKSTHNHYAYLFQFMGNGIHKSVECSGVGECDRKTGQCQCLPGFEGDACQRISCPNACSEHGRCISINELYGSDKYIGFGNDKNENGRILTCKCDVGFRGADCSLIECPSGYDPLQDCNIKADDNKFTPDCEMRDCSGRGICDYSTGKCTCFEGFYGTDCSGII